MIRHLLRKTKPTLAFSQIKGVNTPGIIFLPGFMSNMNGQKALAIEDWCKKRQHPFVRFDYHGTGLSEGPLTYFKNWIEDASDVMANLTCGPQILVGSSMGAYVMLHLAKLFQNRVVSMIGVAPALYFPNSVRKWLKDNHGTLNDQIKIPSLYSDDYLLPVNFFDGLNSLDIDFTKLTLPCSMHLIHGMLDPCLPWQNTLNFYQALVNADTPHDVLLTLKNQGDHRLSTERDILLILDSLNNLVRNIDKSTCL